MTRMPLGFLLLILMGCGAGGDDAPTSAVVDDGFEEDSRRIEKWEPLPQYGVQLFRQHQLDGDAYELISFESNERAARWIYKHYSRMHLAIEAGPAPDFPVKRVFATYEAVYDGDYELTPGFLSLPVTYIVDPNATDWVFDTFDESFGTNETKEIHQSNFRGHTVRLIPGPVPMVTSIEIVKAEDKVVDSES